MKYQREEKFEIRLFGHGIELLLWNKYNNVIFHVYIQKTKVFNRITCINYWEAEVIFQLIHFLTWIHQTYFMQKSHVNNIVVKIAKLDSMEIIQARFSFDVIPKIFALAPPAFIR